MLGAGQGQGHPLQKLKVPKRRPSGERGSEEEGVALLQDPWGFVGGWRKAGEMGGELRARPRPLLQASSDSHHHPCHHWRFPGRW